MPGCEGSPQSVTTCKTTSRYHRMKIISGTDNTACEPRVDCKCGTMVLWGSEDGREYGGENGSGTTMKGYQPGEVSYLSPWCRPRGECDNARPGPKFRWNIPLILTLPGVCKATGLQSVDRSFRIVALQKHEFVLIK